MRADGRDATSRHSPVGGQAQSRVAQARARTRTRTRTGAGGPSGSGPRKQACAGAPGLAGTRFQATRDGSVDAAQERRRDVLRESSGPAGPCRRGAGGQLTRNSAFRSFLADRLGRGTDGDGHVPAASRLRRSLGLRLAGVPQPPGRGGGAPVTSANSYSVGFPQGPEGTVLKRRSPRHSFSQNEGSVRTGPTPGPKGAQAVRFWGSEVESLRENVPVPARWPGGPVTGTCSPAGTRSSPAAGPAASPLCPSSGVWLVGPPTDVLGGFGVDWRRGGGSSPAWATVPVPSTAAGFAECRRHRSQPRGPGSLHAPLCSGGVDRPCRPGFRWRRLGWQAVR